MIQPTRNTNSDCPRYRRYFNTVGSKEGWTPSTFVSSRTNRRKDDASAAQQRPEDFMDEEDLQDAEEARKIQTNAAFAGLGSAGDDGGRASGLMGIFRTQGETAGTKLLRRMGWKEGQGIGPKIRRRARLDTRGAAVGQGAETYLFAPENVVMIHIVRKTDRRGLGYDGQPSLGILGSTTKNGLADQSDDEDADEGGLGRPRFTPTQKPGKAENQKRGGIGMGILNDTGSDDEDPYEIGPRISYNRVIGGDKKKKKKGSNTSANPSVKSKPTFLPNRSALGRVGAGLRKGHDGKLPLDGFVFGQGQDSLTLEINSKGKFPPPAIPEGWKSSKLSKSASDKEQGAYVSTADAAKASKMDPKARAALLGEKQLPGKSIFDFMSASSRERLVAVTGNANLPQAKGEMPAGSALTEEERFRELMSQVPKLDKETAVAAIARGAGGGGPYSDDEAKRTRFRAYLELQAGFSNAPLQKPPKISNDDWIRELHEFFNCARIFKPMTGMMASRFTTSSAASMGSSQGKTDDRTLVSKPAPAPQDPAEEAARLGMFGQMTRTVADFYPTRLLCKRFGVRPPAHVQLDQGADTATSSKQGQSSQFGVYDFADPRPLPLAIDFNGGGGGGGASTDPQSGSRESPVGAGLQKMPDQQQPVGQPKEPVIDSSRNEALEGKRAGEEVFKAIFGDDSDEEG